MQDPVGKSDDGDSKLVTGRITIEASLNLPAWVRKQVKTVIDLCRTSKGSLTSGNGAHAKAIGPNSVAVCAGLNGRAAAGKNGAVAVSWWDGTRQRVTVGYAGENGIQARRWYKADENGKLVDDGAAE